MKANLNGYYKEIEKTTAQKADLLALLSGQKVDEYTNEDADFDYMENDDVALVVRNPHGGEDLIVELGAEFSLFFEKWQGHYDVFQSDYAQLKKDITAILSGMAGTVNLLAGGRWVSSALCSGIPETSADPEELLKRYDAGDEITRRMHQQGGTIEVVCWQPSQTRRFTVAKQN